MAPTTNHIFTLFNFPFNFIGLINKHINSIFVTCMAIFSLFYFVGMVSNLASKIILNCCFFKEINKFNFLKRHNSQQTIKKNLFSLSNFFLSHLSKLFRCQCVSSASVTASV